PGCQFLPLPLTLSVPDSESRSGPRVERLVLRARGGGSSSSASSALALVALVSAFVALVSVVVPARDLPRLTVSASRKTRTSVLVGAPNGVPSQPPFLSSIPGWMPPVISRVCPSGQFLTVWSRWSWKPRGRRSTSPAGPARGGR